MQIYSNYLPNQPVSDSPSFGAAKDITLKYVVSKYPHILPERVFEAAKNIINTIPKNKRPTLYDLHLEQYKGLLECRTLNEARNLYPEFREVLDASIFRNSRSKHLKNLKVSLEDLSLRVLQDYYGRLIPQHEIGTELGFVSIGASITLLFTSTLPIFRLGSVILMQVLYSLLGVFCVFILLFC